MPLDGAVMPDNAWEAGVFLTIKGQRNCLVRRQQGNLFDDLAESIRVMGHLAVPRVRDDRGAIIGFRYSAFGSFDMRSRRSCMSFIWRRSSSMLPPSAAGSGAFSVSVAPVDPPPRGGTNGLNMEKVC